MLSIPSTSSAYLPQSNKTKRGWGRGGERGERGGGEGEGMGVWTEMKEKKGL